MTAKYEVLNVSTLENTGGGGLGAAARTLSEYPYHEQEKNNFLNILVA